LLLLLLLLLKRGFTISITSFLKTLHLSRAKPVDEHTLTYVPIAYNKWHETELERWLSDNNVPYPTPADRKDLENLVKDNWQSKISTPYNEWDAARLNSFLKQKGVETKDTAAENTEGLIAQVKNYWYETEDKADAAWGDVKEWIFDSWTGNFFILIIQAHQLIFGRFSTQSIR
jgi:hypothetical protein